MSYNLDYLFKKHSEIEKEILNHSFFKLNRDTAIYYLFSRLETSILISKGEIFTLFQSEDLFKSFNLLVNVIQDAVPFILSHLSNQSKNDETIDIDPLELMKLLNIISDYLEFSRFIELYKNKIVRVIMTGNYIQFEYEKDLFRINDIYNGFWHSLEQSNALIGVDQLQDITNNMFDLIVDINFGSFTLEEYKVFCKGLDSLIFQKLSNPIKIVNEVGFLVLTEDEWIHKLSPYMSSLSHNKIATIINYLKYDFSNSESDPNISYFIPMNGKLLLSFNLFLCQRLDKNLLRLLKEKNLSLYQNEQKKLEKHQIEQIKANASTWYDFDVDKDGSPGEDLIVYDKRENIVQVIELKYKLPVHTVKEIKNLKKLLSKATKQNRTAERGLNIQNIFQKYFDGKYKDITPKKIIFFSLTNYSIDYSSSNHVLLVDHYIELLKRSGCSDRMESTFQDKFKGINIYPKIKYKKINLFGNIIKVPKNYSKIP